MHISVHVMTMYNILTQFTVEVVSGFVGQLIESFDLVGNRSKNREGKRREDEWNEGSKSVITL